MRSGGYEMGWVQDEVSMTWSGYKTDGVVTGESGYEMEWVQD